MPTPLNILFVEDSKDDTELMLAELRRTGLDPKWKRVDTEAEFVAALADPPDIILSDLSMPRFSWLRATEILNGSCLEIPLILVSGTVGEEIAVEAMRHGAADYLLKDRIARLGSAVQRAVEARRLRDEGRRAAEGKTEVELRFEELERRKARILNALPAHIALVAPDGIILSVNEAWRRFAVANMLPDSDFGVGSNYLKVCESARGEHSEEAFAAAAGVRRILDGEAGEFTIEYPCNSPTEERWFRLIATPLAEGRQAGAVVMHINTTEQRRAELALKRSERDMRLLAERLELERSRLVTAQAVAKIGSWETDAMTLMSSWSDEMHRVFETDATRFHPTHQAFLDLVHPEDRAAVEEDFARSFAHGSDNVTEHRLCLPDGRVKWLEQRWHVFRDERDTPLRAVGTCQDITERRELEEQFRQAQKMEAIGQLAGGVAHDFNNILGAMTMQAEMAIQCAGMPAEAAEFLLDIKACVERAAGLTRQLLAFSRRHVMQFRELDLNQAVGDVAKMLQRILGEDVQLELNLHPHPLRVQADEGMLDQVLLNLAVNSRDAMPQGGRLVIQTLERATTEEDGRTLADAPPGRHVCLRVSDNGSGIAPEVLPHIFEPFFTTKEVGKGTGLGLATAFGIVKQHRGVLKVVSQVGVGTTFEILLPAGAAERGDSPKAGDSPSVSTGAETILVVEDDAVLRRSTRLILERGGFRVLEAATGPEALDVWDAHGERVALLMTDMVMPGGVHGLELAARLRQRRPGLKVVFTSGYSVELAGRELKPEEQDNFIHKPCMPDKIVKTIRRCLDS